MRVAQSRKGRRPMRVDTMLRKEKEGTLYKFTKAGTAGSEQSRLEYQEVDPKATGTPAHPKKKKGDVPSREDITGKVTAEERQQARHANIHSSEGFNAPEGFSGY